MKKYKLIWNHYGFWLELLPNGQDGMTFEEGKQYIIDTHKKCIDIWKKCSEEEFLNDIVTKIENQNVSLS